jgi:hypothetical protein
MPHACNDRRYLCSELVTLRWSPSWGPTIETHANLESIWTSGATLTTECPVAEKTLLLIRTWGCELRGYVTLCMPNGFDYTVELEFLPQSRWDLTKFVPDHLFDPSVLLGFPTLVAAS